MTLDHRQDPVKKLKAGYLPLKATILSFCNVEWFSHVLRAINALYIYSPSLLGQMLSRTSGPRDYYSPKSY